jgi:hypothetical protein
LGSITRSTKTSETYAEGAAMSSHGGTMGKTTDPRVVSWKTPLDASGDGMGSSTGGMVELSG